MQVKELGVLASLAAAALLSGCAGRTAGVPAGTGSAPAGVATSITAVGALDGPYAVTRVVDGDTLWVSEGGRRVKVRLIGINSPELRQPPDAPQCYATEATQRMTALVSGGAVRLEYDPSQARLDKYGRTLAFVWRTDGVLVNADMVAGGWAREFTYDKPYVYQQQFRAAQQDARAAERGLWSAQTCGGER